MPDTMINPMDTASPYLSIVTAIGAGQHTPEWLTQMRLFLAATAQLAAKHHLLTEIVLVDWRMADGTKVGPQLGTLPHNDYVTIRIIDAPVAEARSGVALDRERQAQNIGIRRARGTFVLAAGADTIFSDAVFSHIARRDLQPKHIYHAFRFDIENFAADTLPAPKDIEIACRRRIYSAGPSVNRVDCHYDGHTDSDWMAWTETVGKKSDLAICVFPLAYSQGNFLLMARDSWMELGGFPEWNVSDKHFDRMVMAQAHYRKWPRILFPWNECYFSASRLRAVDPAKDAYIDADGDLRIRVESPIIRPFNDYHVLNILIRLKSVFESDPTLMPADIRLGRPDWGMAEQDFKEQVQAATATA